MRYVWIGLGGLFLAGSVMPFVVIGSHETGFPLAAWMVWLIVGLCLLVVWRAAAWLHT